MTVFPFQNYFFLDEFHVKEKFIDFTQNLFFHPTVSECKWLHQMRFQRNQALIEFLLALYTADFLLKLQIFEFQDSFIFFLILHLIYWNIFGKIWLRIIEIIIRRVNFLHSNHVLLGFMNLQKISRFIDFFQLLSPLSLSSYRVCAWDHWMVSLPLFSFISNVPFLLHACFIFIL